MHEDPRDAVHMVQQIIKYSDGSENVINYRGVIKDGILYPDNRDEPVEKPNLVERVKRAYKKRTNK